MVDPYPWSAAGCAVFRPGTDRVLLLHDPRKGWDLPKGKRERGETPFDTALRETREEAGVRVHTSPHSWIWIPEIFIFVGTSSDPVALLPNPDSGEIEHDTGAFFPLAQACAMVLPSLSPALVGIRNISLSGQRGHCL